jgi:transcriptional regulator NrdR family protein
MTCPICGGKTKVVDCAADVECIYRRRRCVDCKHHFTTTEQESNDTDILYSLRNGRRKI